MAPGRDPLVKRLGQGTANAGVVGIIEKQDAHAAAAVDDPLHLLFPHPPGHVRGRLGVDRVAPEGEVGKHAPHILMPGEEEGPGHLIAQDRMVVAQGRQKGVGILPESRIERRQLQNARRGGVVHGEVPGLPAEAKFSAS